jgi:SNF2 family DNA or RNA helicase
LEHEDQESDANFEKYTAALQTIEEEKQRRLVVTSAYQRNVRESSDVKVSVKNRMMDLRKCTNHPYLIEYPLSEDGVFYRTDEEIVEKCGKLKVLDQMLSELLKRGHKVLIFSQMTRMLDILGDYLNLRVRQYFFPMISTPHTRFFNLGLQVFPA